MRFWVGLVAAFIALVQPARAEWTEVSSDHFLIYGEQSPSVLTKFAERLELLHAAMAFRHARNLIKPSPSNRVTIYAVSDVAKVRKLGELANNAAGVYIPRAGAIMAITPRISQAEDKTEMGGETILYHEYAHHFMFHITNRAMPKWFVEGFAEFYSGLKFTDDALGVGLPADHRANEFAFGFKVPIRTLLRAEGDAGADTRGNSFYAQSWLLMHYLTFSRERATQFPVYFSLLAKGTPALTAAETAFGDLDQLSKDLDAYFAKRALSYLPIARTKLTYGPITTRTISPGHAAMIYPIIKAQRRVDDEEAKALVVTVRQIAAKYPDDVAVQIALAEAEIDAKNPDAGLVAADRAIALDPKAIKAYLQKGRSLFRKAQDSHKPEDWQAARNLYLAANRMEMDNPIPLIEFYRTFIESGITPSKSSIIGIERAAVLAPFDRGLQWMVADQYARDGRYAEAISKLEPIAYSPHQGESAKNAQARIAEWQAKTKANLAKP
jgi:hypothetical protein